MTEGSGSLDHGVRSGQKLPNEALEDWVRGFCANLVFLNAAGAIREAQPFPLTKPKWPRGAMLAQETKPNSSKLNRFAAG